MAVPAPPEAAADPVHRVFRVAGLLTFFALGMPDGLLGAAWPQMRERFHQPASALSFLLVAGTAAFFLSTSLSARIAHRYGGRRLLMFSTMCAAGGGVSIAASPSVLIAVVGVAALSGGAGLVDALVSSRVSLAGDARLLSLMHGVYAVGAAGAPLALASWHSAVAWRFVYLTVSLAYGGLLVSWSRLPAAELSTTRAAATSDLRSVTVPRLRSLLLPLLTFVAASGLEIAAGAWAAVYVSDGLHHDDGLASVASLNFWAALCMVRLASGRGGIDRARRWLVGGSLVSASGGVLLWASTAVPVVLAAFALIGAGAGPMLPLLTVLTPVRVGRDVAARVIGWQLAAASVGSAGIAGGIGLLVHRYGLNSVPAALGVMGIVTAVLIVALDHRTAGRRSVSRADSYRPH